jgi:hypothetical protein
MIDRRTEPTDRTPARPARSAAWPWLAVGIVCSLVVAPRTEAQFWDKLTNPKVKIEIKHPPGLGLQVTKVAFGPARGQGSDEFIDALTELFVKANVEVLERQQLESLLREHDFSFSGYVDQQTAAAIGRIVGPSVMVFVNIQRYATEQKKLYRDWKDNKGFPHRTWISRTQAFVKGSIKSVDLATGRIFAASTLDASPSVENTSEDQCCAEFPGEFDVLDKALRAAVGQARRLYLPWSELTELYFFDDKDCNLKAAYSMFKAGDAKSALEQSMTNLELCKTLGEGKVKALAHAYHNAGMAHLALGDPEKALQYLGEAQRTKAADIHTEAMGDCRRAIQLGREMQRVEEKMALDATFAESRRRAAQTGSGGATGRGAAAEPAALPGAAPTQGGSGAAATPSAVPIEERLKKLDDLLKKGLISKDDYERKKAELLKEL